MTQQRLKKTFTSALILMLLCGCAGMGVSPADKKLANASINLAEAYLSEKKTSQAVKELVKARELDPKNAIIYNDFGLAYDQKRDYNNSIISFKKALELNPDYSVAKNNLGSMYLKMEEWDKAIPIFKDVADDLLYAKPHHPLTNLGWAYYNKKDYKQAETYLLKALEFQPGYVRAQIHLGRVYLATGRLNQARVLFEKIAENNPKNSVLLYEMGRTYRMLGAYNDSILALKAAIEYTEDSDLAVKAAEELKKVYRQ